nr:hypothetical protein [Tanacetum cinerariifolium]
EQSWHNLHTYLTDINVSLTTIKLYLHNSANFFSKGITQTHQWEHFFTSNGKALSWKPYQGDSLNLPDHRQETHISQQSGYGTNEGTSKPGVPDVPSNDSEEELSWKSSDDEDVGGHKEGNKSDESDDDRDEGSDDDSEETVKAGAGKDDDDDDDEDYDDNDEEEELAKSNEEDKETGKGGDEVRESEGESDEEETRQEEDENFDLIPRTPEESEEERNDEEDQDLRLSEEARIQEEEDADELLSATAKGKQPARATSPTDPSDVERTEAKQLKIILRRSRHETHISQQGGSSTNERTRSKPGVPDGADEETESDGKSKEEETTEKEEESIDLIPRTPEESEDDGNGEEDQDVRISEEEIMQEEEEADELYHDEQSWHNLHTSSTDINVSLTMIKLYLHNSANFFSKGITLTHQWEHFFTSSGNFITGSGNDLSILFPTNCPL